MPLASGLQSQRILVTGASQGIGFGVAKAFLEEGAKVVINSSNEERLNKARDELSRLGEVYAVSADLSEKTGVERIVSDTVKVLGGIDVLAYSTGAPPTGTVMDKNYEDWDKAAKLLTISPTYLARKVAEEMIAKKTKGRMIFSSSYVIKEPAPNLALSNICRVAIMGLVRTLARELGSKGIRVNGIMPGYIKTARVDSLAANISRKKGVTEKQALDEIANQIPLGYIGSTQELAKTFIFLGSEMSSYVSGAMIPVDGAILKSIG